MNELVESHDTFLFDCDGVLWQHTTAIPGAFETLTYLRSLGKRLLFVTNNSSKSRDTYVKKFASFGFDISKEQVFSSSYSAAYYMKHQLKLEKKTYVIGMKGVTDELEEAGLEYCGYEDDVINFETLEELQDILPDDEIGAVLVGFDLHINYKKLSKAFTYLKSNSSCHFLATNTDFTYPAFGTVFPGTGSLVSVLTTALNKKPLVLGKPHQPMLDVIVDKYHLDRHKTCMVGDRLDTDIAFGKFGGVSTLLVLSGVTSQDELSTSSIQPDYVLPSLGHLKSSSS